LANKNSGLLLLIGRILLSFIFIMSALNKLGDLSGTSAYMTSKGMPAVPFFLVMAIILELGGGLLVLLGFRARIGVLALVVFLIPTTLIFHNFWALTGMDKQMQTIQFMKNMAIIGGLLILGASGPGLFSFDEH
jgi:putative oxidoreductase